MKLLAFLLACFLSVPSLAAYLAAGPLLRAPSATGFTVWVMASESATVSLETSPTGADTWTVKDSDTTDPALFETALLDATGLSAGTKYDYRVKVDGVVVGAYSTRTMPATTGGRFVAYLIADPHSINADACRMALAHYRTQFEPLGVPAVLLIIGDYSVITPDIAPTDGVEVFLGITLSEIEETGDCLRYLPFLYQFDDWDFAGNNSSSTRFPIDGSMANVDVFHQTLWRQPGGKVASPSWAYQAVIAGVPIIFSDQRSQRTQVGITPFVDGNNGTAAVSDSYTVFGSAQRTWLTARMAEYRTKGLILFISGGTMRDHQTGSTPGTSPPARDSLGLYFKGERNVVLNGLNSGGFPAGTNLVVLSGDDHRHTVWTQDFYSTPYSVESNPSGGTLGFTSVEIKTSTAPGGTVGSSPGWFGDGNLFDHTSMKPSVLVADITSSSSGATVTARFTFLEVATGMVPWKDGSSRIGDFRLTGGAFTAYGGP